MKNRLVMLGDDGRCELLSPTAMPRASAFLFNPGMMVQVNCRGFVTAQHMQPEPAKYAHPPMLEAGGFMQPEQPYFAHHPGRFVYVKDENSGELFSVPHEPVRKTAERFEFSAGPSDIHWVVEQPGLESRLELSLPVKDTVELWSFEIRNTGKTARKVSVYPFFTIGYMSWMNQSARYDPERGGIIAHSISGYQKLEDREKIRSFKDRTFLLHDTRPDAWETSLEAFEGEGGLHLPDGIQAARLANGEALYEMPAAVLQYRLGLAPGERRRFRFLFGPANGLEEISELRDRYFAKGAFRHAKQACDRYLEQGHGCLDISTPDGGFDHFFNGWLGRQVYYHGATNRLTTDPQTRNYLQDAMGMAYFQAEASRQAILNSLAQQENNGALPDGIRLLEGTELKYINQVPHTDHGVWLPVCLEAYLDETGDFALLDEAVIDTAGAVQTVSERIDRVVDYLLLNTDHRQLSLIAQGDWCDPMNMVGPEGRGVSGWLSIATIHALNLWASICRLTGRSDRADQLEHSGRQIECAVQEHLWAGDRFARGITDAGRRFGILDDDEGRLFLNPQSWSLMAGVVNEEQKAAILKSVKDELETPFGPQMLAPAYTRMHDDIGRVTQKFPGSAENGSVYNHAAAFYIHALYLAGQPDHAWQQIRQMLPGPDEEDMLQRGQLPVFIPNYFRGAIDLYPATAGRSSQLFNTGTASWIYRIVVEQMFGLKGCREGLAVRPALPAQWNSASATRRFRGGVFEVSYRRQGDQRRISLDGMEISGDTISDIEAGRSYQLDVTLPETLS